MCQPHKMVKHTQTICRWIVWADELLECFWPFCAVGTYGILLQPGDISKNENTNTVESQYHNIFESLLTWMIFMFLLVTTDRYFMWYTNPEEKFKKNPEKIKQLSFNSQWFFNLIFCGLELAQQCYKYPSRT